LERSIENRCGIHIRGENQKHYKPGVTLFFIKNYTGKARRNHPQVHWNIFGYPSAKVNK